MVRLSFFPFPNPSIRLTGVLTSIHTQYTLTSPRGVVRNIVFSNFNIAGASSGPNINEDSGDNGNYVGTSKLEISNIAFVNFTGYISTQARQTAAISCSKVYPCYNISFKGIDLATTKGGTPEGATGSCQFVANKGVSGMTGNGC